MSTFTPEQIERTRVFLKDLRANPKKAKEKMRTSDGGRCCMCVVLDSAEAQGAELPEGNHHFPPDEMFQWFGWPLSLRLRVGSATHCIYSLNDGTSRAPELTHAEIADAFEETWPELKPPPSAAED